MAEDGPGHFPPEVVAALKPEELTNHRNRHIRLFFLVTCYIP